MALSLSSLSPLNLSPKNKTLNLIAPSQSLSPLSLKPSSYRPIRLPRSLPLNSAFQLETPAAQTPSKRPPFLPFRIGHGFDLHRLEPDHPLIIGGDGIPHDRGCDAHSDGDVLLHCVVDAILGTLRLPDIGQIFPDTDPK